MNDYENLGLSDQLQSLTGLVSKTQLSSYQVDSQIEPSRGYIDFSKVAGGTITLGGTNNIGGVLKVINPNGTTDLFRANNGTVAMVFPTGGTFFVADSINETLSIGGGVNLGGTSLGVSAEGGLVFKSGTITFSSLTVDEFAIFKRIRMGGTESAQANHAYPIELYGTSTGGNPVGTPPANACRLYLDNAGAGAKNRIMAQFDSGTPVVITTEP